MNDRDVRANEPKFGRLMAHESRRGIPRIRVEPAEKRLDRVGPYAAATKGINPHRFRRVDSAFSVSIARAHGFGTSLNHVKDRDAIRGTPLTCEVASDGQHQYKDRSGSTHSLSMHKSADEDQRPNGPHFSCKGAARLPSPAHSTQDKARWRPQIGAFGSCKAGQAARSDSTMLPQVNADADNEVVERPLVVAPGDEIFERCEELVIPDRPRNVYPGMHRRVGAWRRETNGPELSRLRHAQDNVGSVKGV